MFGFRTLTVHNTNFVLPGDECFCSSVRLPLEQIWSWQLSGQGQGGKGVHDQVNPEHLDSLEENIAY